MQAQPVLEAFIGHVRAVNFDATHYMRTVAVPNKARIQARLAALAGCGADELIITRNTTESLDTVIAGFDWKPGDEAGFLSVSSAHPDVTSGAKATYRADEIFEGLQRTTALLAPFP